MTDFLMAGLILAFPTILHYSFLWGEALLEKVVTPFAWFNALFNQRPLLISIGAGVFLAAAFLMRGRSVAIEALLINGLALIVLDFVGCSISLMRHLQKKRH